jgi:nucleotide-binding universal stress UspA family protein
MKERMRILLGYDGSPCADAALDDLARAGLPREADVLVVSVTETWLPPPPPSVYRVMEVAVVAHTPAGLQEEFTKDSPAMGAARSMAEAAQGRLRKNFPGWQVSAEALFGSPARELIARADEWAPDLVVVGSHGRTALGRFVLGSVSQKVLTESRNSVRVGRGRVGADHAPARILVGVDGSDEASLAVREAARRFWPPRSEARVVVVDDPLEASPVGRIIPPVANWVEETNREERAWARELAERAAAELRDAGLSVTPAVVEGNPKRVLVEEAEAWGADCVFVGSTGLGRVERFVLGSVSAAVAARAHCSVEVVRAPRAE